MKVAPMDNSFVLYRCLHAGLLSPTNIEEKCKNVPGLSEEQTARNNVFLSRMIDMYGSCAMLALEGEYAVGYARFYPEIIYDLVGRKHICCQDQNNPIDSAMINVKLPQDDSRTGVALRINCWFVHKDYRNRGLSRLLLQAILRWAAERGWAAVRASAAADNFWVASQACALMLRTYRKNGFRLIDTKTAPELKQYLVQIRQGQHGAAKQQEFEQYCRNRDLSEIAVYHTVECALTRRKTV